MLTWTLVEASHLLMWLHSNQYMRLARLTLAHVYMCCNHMPQWQHEQTYSLQKNNTMQKQPYRLLHTTALRYFSPVLEGPSMRLKQLQLDVYSISGLSDRTNFKDVCCPDYFCNADIGLLGIGLIQISYSFQYPPENFLLYVGNFFGLK